MSMIRVKAKKGLTVRESPDGKYIPDDRYVDVENTHYIQRMINFWKDLEVEAAPKKSPVPKKVEPLPEPLPETPSA